MTLDLTPFEKAVLSLEEALKARDKEPDNDFIRDSCIQRFEYTYELSWKTLKRYLEMTEAAVENIDTLRFPDLIRTGSEKELLLNDWTKWTLYRDARNITSHTYDEKKAEKVLAQIPDFAKDARYLLEEIQKRQQA